MSIADKITPEHIKKLIPYQSARRIGGKGRVWLNANELEEPIPLSCSNLDYHRYPDFLPSDVALQYQQYCGTQQPVVAVRGADEAIDLLIRTFCQPGADNIVFSSPTYAMYEFCADSLAVSSIDVPLVQPSFSLDIDGVSFAAQQAKLLFLCSPNNPTGQPLGYSKIKAVLERTKDSCLVVVDEAYIEFAPQESVVDLIDEYPHLIVIRTLSKAFGLAAVRCGFIIASASVMKYIHKLIPPYPMPDTTSSIVIEALSDEGVRSMISSTERLNAIKTNFIESIQSLDLIRHIYPTSTNFVLIKVQPEVRLFEYLMEHGVVTRNQAHEPSLKDCVRITIGSQASMDEVAQLIQQYSNTQYHTHSSKGLEI